VKLPRQARSQKTLDRIASATLDLLAEGGTDAVTVAAVVGRARTSVGSFYARFAGKEELVAYVRGRALAEVEERWKQELAGRDWAAPDREGMVEQVVGALLRLEQDAPWRRGGHHSRWVGEELAPGLARRFANHALPTVISLLGSRAQEIAHPDPLVAFRIGFWMTLGGVREALAAEHAQEGPEEKEMLGRSRVGGATSEGPPGGVHLALAAELAAAWNAYLSWGMPSGQARGEGQVDFFAPWG
jgi:AcrR family transcriptional regulator